MNLRDEQLPYKYFIGQVRNGSSLSNSRTSAMHRLYSSPNLIFIAPRRQVILDKNRNIRTVVNKLRSIDTTYRFFQMELLAGKEDYICTVRESGCSFAFDFSKV